MSKPAYRYRDDDIADIGIAARHAMNKDEIGLYGRILVLCRLISRQNKERIEYLYLYFAQGMSLDDAAQYRNVRPSTVSRMVTNAIAEINEVLYCVNVTGDENGIFRPILKRKEG